ncbi:DUF4044 domain-containing protein [Leuconostoc carnosum]|uniref:DUF4044 domain-containing protein n=1 Tax=Leuconostoc carnosum TaxID=1252 RepID=UPI00345DC991
MTNDSNPRPVNTKLQVEIDAKLNQRKVQKIEPKRRTRIEKMTLIMSWFMVILMVGGMFYAAVNALGWM